MKAQVLRLDDAAHQGAEILLPWFVNGSLTGEDLVNVERHLGECARCQREADWLREVQTAYRATEFASDAMRSAFNRLRPLLDRPAGIARVFSFVQEAARFWRRTDRWAKWTIAMEFALILSFGFVAVAEGEREKVYQALGVANEAHVAGSVVVVFEPSTMEAQISQIVRESGARIVDGPTQSDAYVLQLAAGQEDTAVQKLRSHRAVTLAEPLVAGNPK